jgi:hypothetical protein
MYQISVINMLWKEVRIDNPEPKIEPKIEPKKEPKKKPKKEPKKEP